MKTKPRQIKRNRFHLYLGKDGEDIFRWYSRRAVLLQRSVSWVMSDAIRQFFKNESAGGK